MQQFKILTIILITMFLSLHVKAEQEAIAQGKVQNVGSNFIKIRTSEINKIAIGAKVNVYHQTSSGKKMKTGEWKVSKKENHYFYATPVDITLTPRKGQLAEVMGSKKETISLLGESYSGPTDPAKQNTLGWNYQKGIGVAIDLEKAVYWYRKSANQGYAPAQDNMGWVYQHGIGVQKNEKKAVTWYLKAAKNGLTIAQDHLGWMYQNGLGTPIDYKKALYWYTQAANKGLANAQNSIGTMYHNGQGVAKNIDTAVMWYKKAAKGGNQYAINNLTNMGLSW